MSQRLLRCAPCYNPRGVFPHEKGTGVVEYGDVLKLNVCFPSAKQCEVILSRKLPEPVQLTCRPLVVMLDNRCAVESGSFCLLHQLSGIKDAAPSGVATRVVMEVKYHWTSICSL